MARRKNNRKGKISHSVRREVSRQLRKNIEMKVLGVEQTEQTIATTTAGYVYSLSQIAEGTGSNERIGDLIQRKGLHLKYLMKPTSTGTATGFIRIIVYSSDTGQLNDATDNFLLDVNDAPQTLTAGDIQDIVGRFNKKQGIVHYDKVHKLQGSGGANESVLVFRNKWLKNVFGKMEFVSATESQRNNLRALVFVRDADNDAGAFNTELTLETRMLYTGA